MMRTKRGSPKFILVGNKYDKQHQREVSIEEGYKKAQAWGCRFYETSAKTRYNVEEAFTSIVRTLRDATGEGPTPVNTSPPTKRKSPWRGCVIL
jgi:GTPase KRas